MNFLRLFVAQCIASVIYVCVGAYSFAYCLDAAFAKNIPWYADAVVGLVAGTLFIPLAIASWVCQLCGIPTPFFV
jgi:hypothetical protein